MKKKDTSKSLKSTVSLDKNRLIRELENSEISLVKKNAIQELAKLNALRAIPPIVNALRDEDWDIRMTAANALDRLGWKKDGGVREAFYCMAKGNWSELVTIGNDAFLPLSDAIHCKEKTTRLKAIEVISEIGGKPAIDLLVSVIKDPDWNIRMQAARALGAFEWKKQGGEKEAVFQIAWSNWKRLVEIGTSSIKPLGAALIHGDTTTRAMAAETLGKIGDKSGIPFLVKALKDKDWNVRKKSAVAAKALGWQAENKEMEVVYLIAGHDWINCAKMGEPAITPLIDILRQKQKQFHDQALKALVTIGKPAVEPLKRLQTKSIVNVAQKIGHAIEEIETMKKPPPPAGLNIASKADQRQGKRLEILTLVYFICLSEKGNEAEQGIGRVLNISSGGVLLETSNFLDFPYIAIYGVGLEENMMELKGKVIHCQKQDTNKYLSGVSFVDKDEERHKIIVELVRVFNRQRQNLPLSD